jgi:DNA polymerase III alpha subunit/nucleotidyltransferase/DNA polymerase involved in DNA repair
MAVGGEKRGIIASASYEARRFGIYTPMPTVRARKLCPRLIVLPGDFEKYERFSRWMFSYAYDFTPHVEIGSIDEGYFDLTGARRSPVEIADTIRTAIRQALKITVSEGIGSSKLISQIASKYRKPAAFEQVPPGHERAFLHPLPNKWLPGLGPKTAARFNAAGLTHIHHIAATPVDQLSLLVGRGAPQLREFANGIDERPIVPVSEPAKSYGQQETFAGDQTDETFIKATLRRMADTLFAKVRADGKSVRTLTVKVRYNDMAEDQCSESLLEPTDLETDIYSRLHTMLRRAWKRRVSLRLVSLKLSNLYNGLFRMELALDRTAQQHEARHRLASTVDALRDEHGRYSVMRGHDLELKSECRVRGAEVNPALWVKDNSPDLELRVLVRRRSGQGDRSRHSVSSTRHEGEGRGQSEPSALRLLPPAFSLCVRSHYSFLNSTLSPEDIVAVAKQHGLSSIALCDQGNLHGAPAFAAAAREAGLQPLFAAEICVKGKPLRLYVENATGYGNLCRLLSGKSGCRSQNAELPDFDSSGLLAVSPDASLASRFPGRFYLSVGHPDELRRLHNPDQLPVVALHPIHYANPGERWKWDILQSIRTRTLLEQAHPEKEQGGEFHCRSPHEWAEQFREHPELLNRTREIAERCARFQFPFGKPQFPAFHTPDGSGSREFLRDLVMEGFEARYGGHSLRNRPSSSVLGRAIKKFGHEDAGRGRWERRRIREQLETELQMIHDVGYEDYFLIVWDLLRGCRAQGIDWITRGSAADSLVCYCLGISSVCPVRFDLYFRRFLNRERMAINKLPDIDIDFPHDRKDDVVNLLFAEYGPEHCAVVGGFSTFKARSAFAEVGKVLGVAEREVRRFTEHFPWRFGGGGEMGIQEKPPRVRPRPSSSAVSTSVSSAKDEDEGRGRLESRLDAQLRLRPETAGLPLEEEPYRSALLMAEFLDGMPRYPKMHPCGVVLSRQPVHELTPTFISQKGWATTHYDMDAVEAIGLVKMDILAQGGLAAMRDAQIELAKRGITVDLERFEVVNRPRPSSSNLFNDRGRGTKDEDEPGLSLAPAKQGEGVVSRLPGSKAARVVGGGSSPRPSLPGEERGHGTRAEGGHSNPLDDRGRGTRTKDENNPLPVPRFDDSEVWDLISSGNARSVHHIESPAMISLCRMTNVRDIDTLIAIVSVIRPGAANEDKKREFTRRYQGLSPITYPHPSLEPCLRSTFGLVVYEEHILQICETFAGLPGGRADVLRRSLVKENWSVVQEIEREFVASARKRGHSEENIAKVWQLVAGFHGYAFCKAHSTAYGVEAYQSAWLKRYFPAEFMAAVLTNGKGFYRPLVYVLECWRLGIGLLPPCVNEPGPAFTVNGSMANPTRPSSFVLESFPSATKDKGRGTKGTAVIRVPVTCIATLTEQMKGRLLTERKRGEFRSLTDFYQRVNPSREELEALSRAGALDIFGRTRCEQFWEIQQLVARWGGSVEPGQGWLFAKAEGRRKNTEIVCSDTSAPSLLPSEFNEPSRLQRLQWEAELLGFPASGHPLELHPDIAWDTYCPVSRLGEFIGDEVTLCGLVIEDRVHHQVTGEPMKFLTLCDWTGMVETELFASTYKSYGLATVRYPVLEVTGRVEVYENQRGHSLRVLRAGKPRTR